ncbi:MAG: hypothetical protein SFV32_07095 [Opitutaceae bacterium]|nr:hypothetical protein [Opitutaceae bacterium]
MNWHVVPADSGFSYQPFYLNIERTSATFDAEVALVLRNKVDITAFVVSSAGRDAERRCAGMKPATHVVRQQVVPKPTYFA